MKRTRGLLLALIPMWLALVTSGCGSDPVAPFEPEVMNQSDTFQLQATGVDGVTTSLSYAWSNTGTEANVDHSTVPSAGTAVLRILDSSGTEVYVRNLAEDGSFMTATGTAGDWLIQVSLSDFEGTLNFRVQKP